MGRFLASLIVVALIGVACGNGTSTTEVSIPQLPDDVTVHIEPGGAHTAYSTIPAASGPHYRSTPPVPAAPFGSPARWGIYDVAIPDEVLVHNLEHGGIGLHYDCPSGCPDLVSRLRGLIPSNPSQFVMSPYPKMQSRVAITAWRRVMYMDDVDEAKIRGFIKAYQDKAPESVKGNLF